MPEPSLAVEYLFTMRGQPAESVLIEGGPQGTRAVVNVPSGEFEGPKLKGVTQAPSGDWSTRRPDGSAKLDVRTTLVTDDGAVILMTYQGIILRDDAGPRIRTAPLFETGDERYAWLNTIQAVGIGTVVEGVITFDVYALV